MPREAADLIRAHQLPDRDNAYVAGTPDRRMASAHYAGQVTSHRTITTFANAAHTISAAEDGQLIKCNYTGGPQTITVPDATVLPIDTGWEAEFFAGQGGAYTVTFAGSGVILRSLGNLFTISGQYGFARLTWLGTNFFLLTGDLA